MPVRQKDYAFRSMRPAVGGDVMPLGMATNSTLSGCHRISAGQLLGRSSSDRVSIARGGARLRHGAMLLAPTESNREPGDGEEAGDEQAAVTDGDRGW